MKAAIRTQYGPPEVLTIREIDKPIPGEGEILIRIKATTVNRTDCGILFGKPFVIKFFTGLIGPKKKTTGTDFAGVVEALGKGVTRFKEGDRVFGFNDNGLESHAEYCCPKVDDLVQAIPEGVDFNQAAAAAEGGHYAINYVYAMNLNGSEKVMVNGGTGAIGSAAIQFLRHFNAEVDAVCGSANIERVKGLGAQKVIDYQNEDFTQLNGQYDIVLDAVGKSRFSSCQRILKEDGVYMSSELGPGSENIYLPLTTRWRGHGRMKFPIPVNIPRSLKFVSQLLASGEFKPMIDRSYELEEIVDAFRYVDSGQKIGNVLLDMT